MKPISFFKAFFVSAACLSATMIADEPEGPYYVGAEGLYGKNRKMDVWGGAVRLGYWYSPNFAMDYELGLLSTHGKLKDLPSSATFNETTVDTTGKIFTTTTYGVNFTSAKGRFNQIPLLLNGRLQFGTDRFLAYIGVGVGVCFVNGAITTQFTGIPTAQTEKDTTPVPPTEISIDPDAFDKTPKSFGPQKHKLGTKTRFAAQAFVGMEVRLSERCSLYAMGKLLYVDPAKLNYFATPGETGSASYQMKAITPLFALGMNCSF